MGNKLIKHVESEEGWLVLFYCGEFMNRLKKGKKKTENLDGRVVEMHASFFMQNAAKMY